MVDRGNLQQVTELYGEMNSLNEAITRLDGGGRIAMMMIAAPEDTEASGIFTPVSTRQMTYPPQMIDGIKQQLTQRLHAIEDELANLGLTGVEPAPRAAAGRRRTKR